MKLLFASLVVIFASGIGAVTSPPLLADSGKAQRVDVSIQDLQFTPATLTIHVGDTVVWTNNDDRDYNLVCKDAGIASGNIRPGQTFEHLFKKAGTFAITCKYHPRMKGTITVEQ
jgi:plastocyanin